MLCQERRAPHSALGAPGPPGGNQPQRLRRPDPRDGPHEVIDQGIQFHGISAWRTERQEFELELGRTRGRVGLGEVAKNSTCTPPCRDKLAWMRRTPSTT